MNITIELYEPEEIASKKENELTLVLRDFPNVNHICLEIVKNNTSSCGLMICDLQELKKALDKISL